jgi:5-methylcytosine-specific restriction endonuclease McrA
MPTEAERAYQREYQLARYHRRRAAAIESLGGKCVECGTTDDLQVDHVDPETKEVENFKAWGRAEAAFWAEIKKCQLLCRRCHIAKTAKERRKEVHGTWGMVRNRKCTCRECKDFVNAYQREWKRKRKESMPGSSVGGAVAC